MLKLRDGGWKYHTFSRVLRKKIFGHKCYKKEQTRSDMTATRKILTSWHETKMWPCDRTISIAFRKKLKIRRKEIFLEKATNLRNKKGST